MAETTIKCFVIMPFDQSFDDVYMIIKATVEGTHCNNRIDCSRLDEHRPAGRITDRLLDALRASDVCVADLTGNKPNVMWEVGYAMALGKPLLIITQNLAEMPFDLKDMQSLEYHRHHLTETLSRPLKKMLLDTLTVQSQVQALESSVTTQHVVSDVPAILSLTHQVHELKDMVSQLVKTWVPTTTSAPMAAPQIDELSKFQGAWINHESGSHIYARLINNKLVVPYCWAGNKELTGVYYDWKKTGDFWFARFKWLNGNVKGFAFMKEESEDILNGSWWYDEEAGGAEPQAPLAGSGVSNKWERRIDASIPSWAKQFWGRASRGEVF